MRNVESHSVGGTRLVSAATSVLFVNPVVSRWRANVLTVRVSWYRDPRATSFNSTLIDKRLSEVSSRGHGSSRLSAYENIFTMTFINAKKIRKEIT